MKNVCVLLFFVGVVLLFNISNRLDQIYVVLDQSRVYPSVIQTQTNDIEDTLIQIRQRLVEIESNTN